jgi:hypothetical protein
MTNKNLLKILFAEDLRSDADLAVLELRKEGLRFEHMRVDTRDEFIKALNEFKPDIIISDYMMPSFNGLQALEEVKVFNPEIPFILCTGSINEETAVECIKAGATDYVIKEHLTRLPFAVKEALEQSMKEKEKKASELLLKENEEKLQSIFSAAPIGIGLVVNRVFMEVNDTFCKMTGYTRKELIGKSSEIIYATKKEYESDGTEKYRQISEKGTGSVETRFKCKNGKILNILLSSAPLDNDDLVKGVTFTAIDITKKIQTEEALANEKYLIYSLMNTLPDHIYFKDLSSRFIRINKAHAQFFGLSDPGQAVGLTDSDFFSGEHANQAYEDEQTIIRTGKSISIEEKETHINRPDTWVSTVKLPLKDKDGNIIGTFGISRDITNRKTTEEALQKSQHLFQTLAQVSPSGIFRTDADGNTTYVNPKWSELSGLSSEEAFGEGWLNAVHPEDRGSLAESWVNNLKSKNESSAEYRFLRPDGSIVWVIGKAVPEMIGNEVTGYIGTITDITERKRTEKALQESEEKYRLLIDTANESIIVGQDGLIKFVNNITLELLEVSSEQELIDKPFPEFIHPDDRRMVVENYRRRIANEEAQQRYAFRVVTRKGIVRWVEINAVLIEWQGRPATLNFLSDITERKLAESVRQESEEKYRRIFENVQDVYYETSIDGTILEISPSIEILSKGQYQMDDLIGKSMFDFYSEPKERQVLLEVLREKGTVTDFEITLKNRDGSYIPCSISSKICLDAQGRPEKIIGSLHDITDRKNATEKLKLAKEKAEASDKLKTTFLNNISHEVRTPLNGILGFAEIMSQPDLSEDDKKESLSMLFESSDRLLNTITNYMDISLITSGTMSIYKKDILPALVLREILSKNKILCSLKNLELALNIPEQAEKISICSDSEILRKIISHLLNNAIKFTEKGSIEYGYSIHKKELEFFVKDTGIGIGKESLKNVFEHFVKEDRGPLKMTEGSGLGLSISEGMVRLLGGKIWVESERGKGSSFFFTLPVEKEFEKHIISPTAGKQKKNIKTSSILVAEDDETNFFYLKTLLAQNTKSDVIHALNGKDAIEKFQQNPDIGLILMDIKMPVMDGLEATRHIKVINPNIPVIAITAYAMAGDESRIAEAGCDYYLTKPINKKLLLDKMAEYISL